MNADLAQRLMRRRPRGFAELDPIGAVAGSTAAVVEPIASAEGWSFGKAVTVGVTVGILTTYAVRILDSIFGGRK